LIDPLPALPVGVSLPPMPEKMRKNKKKKDQDSEIMKKYQDER